MDKSSHNADQTRDDSLRHIDLPTWAIEHADAAFCCGMKAPAVEKLLQEKGLPVSVAAAVIDQCFKTRYEAQQQQQQRRLRWKWINRVASLALACCYVAASFHLAEFAAAIYRAIGLLLPLACIWFSEPLGNYLRSGGLVTRRIDRPTPGVFVAIGGWILLLGVPLVLLIFR